MQKRHDDELTNRLEKIITDGSVYISWNELYLWYDVQKLAAGSYRDLASRWDDVSRGILTKDGEVLGTLSFVQSATTVTPGMYLFGSNMPRVVYE